MDYGHTQPRVEMKYTIIICLLPAVVSLSNMYQPKSGAYNSQATGMICYNFSEYIPKCGWKTILKSPVPLNSIKFSDQSVAQLDNYTFITINGQWNGDLSQKSPGSCSDFTFTGSFGNIMPSLSVTWYCICDASTNKTCKIVYVNETASSSTSSTLQTQQSSTTTTTTTVTQSSQFASLTHNSASSTLTTEKSSNIDTFEDTAKGTSFISQSTVASTADINPISVITSPVTVNSPPLTSATTEDISSTKCTYSSATDQSLWNNPVTTDSVHASDTSTTSLSASMTTRAIASTITSAASNTISPSRAEADGENVVTMNTLTASREIVVLSTITSDTARFMEPLSTYIDHEDVATTSTTSTSVPKRTSSTITISTSDITSPSSTDTTPEEVATTNTLSSATILATDINPSSVFLSDGSKEQISDTFPTTLSDTVVILTSSTMLTHSTTIVSIISTNGLTTLSFLGQTYWSMTPAATKSSSVFTTAPTLGTTNTHFQEDNATTTVSPSLTFTATRMTSLSTSATIFATTMATSSVLMGERASTTSPVLETTSSRPVETNLPWSIYLHKISEACYTGQNYKTITNARHIIDCAARCIRDTACKGINFRKSTKQCDLIDDVKSSTTWEMNGVVGCTFWEMVWKH